MKKGKNESIENFKKRVFDAKDIQGWNWQDVRDEINRECNLNWGADKYRKECYKYWDSLAEDITAQSEKVKIRQERNQINSMIRNTARNDILKEIAKEVAETISSKKQLEAPKLIKEHGDNSGILAIGDWHIGLDIDIYNNKYNLDIAKKRINKLQDNVLHYVKEDKIKKLYVLNQNDLISGNIHLPLRINTQIDVMQQTIIASELLSELLNNLSKQVKIEYYSVSDNHSRITPKKDESIRTEQLSVLIDHIIKIRLSNNKNINFNENKISSDIATFNVEGHNIAGVHGDRDSFRKIINNINNYTGVKHKIIITAHLHHYDAGSDNGTQYYCNGSLCGADDYCESLRLWSEPMQLLLVVGKDNPYKTQHQILL